MKNIILFAAFTFIGVSCASVPRQTSWIPFEMKGEKIIVPISVKRKPVSALIDTGASITVIDRKLADKLNIRGSERNFLSTLADIQYVEYAKSVPFNFYGAEIYLDVAIKDLASEEYQVVFGSSLLRGVVTEFDFPHKQMRFHKLGAYKYAGPTKPISIYERRGLYHMDLNIDGKERSFMIDTGASGSIALPLDEEDVQKKLKNGSKKTRLIGGNQEVVIAAEEVAKPFSLGSYEINNAKIHYYDPKIGYSLEGIIGMRVFKEFTLIIDTDHDAMYVEAYE